MSETKLTKKHQACLNNYILQTPPRDKTKAYIDAGYAKNNAQQGAYQLFRKPQFILAMSELDKRVKSEFEWSRLKLILITQDIIEQAVKRVDPNDKNSEMNDGRLAIVSIKQLCEMQGYNAVEHKQLERIIKLERLLKLKDSGAFKPELIENFADEI